jgi:formylglycine-generating enzyme required for sulfatase activity
VIGNVWEWCADWYGERYYEQSPRLRPSGPATGIERVMRGGSWMCSENYCTNYRPGARSHATPDTGLNNTGFRLVRDARRAEASVPGIVRKHRSVMAGGLSHCQSGGID